MNGFSNRASFPYSETVCKRSFCRPFAAVSFLFSGAGCHLARADCEGVEGVIATAAQWRAKNSKNVLNKLIKRKNTADTGNRSFHGKAVFLWFKSNFSTMNMKRIWNGRLTGF
jgi:hypothetical protein